MLKKMKKGFTLIELMIVVAIIGILAAIAIPNFIRYQLKSKQGEAKSVIGGLRTALEGFRAEYDAYPQNLAANPAMAGMANKQPWVNSPCPNTCTRLNAATAGCEFYECIGYQPSGALYYQYDEVANAAMGWSFSISADCDLDEDGMVGNWAFGLDTDGDSALDVGIPGACTNPPAAAGQFGILHECDNGEF